MSYLHTQRPRPLYVDLKQKRVLHDKNTPLLAAHVVSIVCILTYVIISVKN